MVTSFKLEAAPGTSLRSLVKGYLLTHQTQGSSPNTVEYYRGILTRFLWFAEKNNWSDDVRLINEWQIREFLGYVGTETNRWEKQGNGAESSYTEVILKNRSSLLWGSTCLFQLDGQGRLCNRNPTS